MKSCKFSLQSHFVFIFFSKSGVVVYRDKTTKCVTVQILMYHLMLYTTTAPAVVNSAPSSLAHWRLPTRTDGKLFISFIYASTTEPSLEVQMYNLCASTILHAVFLLRPCVQMKY